LQEPPELLPVLAQELPRVLRPQELLVPEKVLPEALQGA
jgi:hypothetical protein